MTNTTTAAPIAPRTTVGTATIAALHTDPYVAVNLGGVEYRLNIDLARVFERTSRPIVEAVVVEAQRLMRRHVGYAPAPGSRAQFDNRRGTLTFAVAEIPGRCDTCLHGCACQPLSDGCAHYRCRAFPAPDLVNSCPGVAVINPPRPQRPTTRHAHLAHR
ncbi:hypothetical protein KBX50_08270 [Micromonospora sp. C51]|uniref:hypothetical protein n=1 Tax=Micromonospora sp. C51 TaxID=2824879 RepID=UPI001B378572|nr:hypothetical protein [Micromonospora sp. C51]MBQ1048459.1 hypothetical protein [Micromonospora sp. C51]